MNSLKKTRHKNIMRLYNINKSLHKGQWQGGEGRGKAPWCAILRDAKLKNIYKLLIICLKKNIFCTSL